ncbi:alpha/beta hydrolase [Nostoc sp. NIES-2111]
MSIDWAALQGRSVTTNGVKMSYRRTGEGEPIILLHGWPQHSLMWHAVGPELAKSFDVIAPDLRGAGGSSITTSGYDKRTMADDVLGLLDALDLPRVDLVGYDLGAGVAYDLAARHTDRVKKLVFAEFGLPGFGYEFEMQPKPDWHNGSNWHLGFFTLPDVAEFAFRGRERELLSWFFWHLSAAGDPVSAAHFEEYVRQISRPGALRAGINYYASVWADRESNLELARTPLPMPVLGIGGEHSAGAWVAQGLRPVATTVSGFAVPYAGHWLGDENPKAFARAILDHLS